MREEPLLAAGGTQTCAVIMEIGRFLRKLATRLPHDLSTPLLGIFPEDSKSAHHGDMRTSVLTVAPAHNSQE